MKTKNNDMTRHVRVRAVMAYPAFSIALVATAALTFTPLSPSAFAASPSPTTTTTTTDAPTPSTSPSATPSTTASTTPSAAPSAAPRTVPSATAPGRVAPGGAPAPGSAAVAHHVLARIEDSTLRATYLSVDQPMRDAGQFQTIRVRFTLHNAGTSAVTAVPQLEFRPTGSTKYTVVPEQALKGVPLHMVREWVASPGGGTKQGPTGADIPVATFLTGDAGGGLAMTGHRSMAANPDRPTTLPSDSFTEQEFTVRLTMDAKYLTGYQFRVTDGKAQLAGTQVARINLGPAPALRLSPGQHKGIAVVGPKPASRTGIVK